MLARLITSHIYAVQPDVDRSVRFAELLYNKLSVDHRVKIMVRSSVNDKLARQLKDTMIGTSVSMPV
jgi:hypothetical protein